MDIRIRRLLLFMSVVIFLIIAPVVVLYALGYRENIISSPTAVGVILLDSIPQDAQVTANDKSYGTTPESIPNLQVGTASVTVSKDGYHPWRKNLPVRPARATEARSIRLFLQDPPSQVVAQDTRVFSLAPNRTLLSWVDSDNLLHVRGTDSEALFTPIALSRVPDQLLWSADSNYLLIAYPDHSYQLVDMASSQLQSESLPTLTGLIEPTWDPRAPGRLLLRDPDANSIIRYSLRQRQQRTIAANISIYAISTRNIYAVNQQQEFLRLSFDGDVENRHSLRLDPDEAIARLLVTPTDNIAAISNHSQLYRYDRNQFTSIAPHVLRAAWSPDGGMLLVQPQTNELFLYNVSNKRAFHLPHQQMHLITRLSRPIRQAQWFAGGHHFIYQVDDAIVITEVDTRDHSISHTVDTTNLGNAYTAVGEEGQSLYYLQKQGQQTRLLQTILYQEE